MCGLYCYYKKGRNGFAVPRGVVRHEMVFLHHVKMMREFEGAYFVVFFSSGGAGKGFFFYVRRFPFSSFVKKYFRNWKNMSYC